jgi:hypothetical protein
MFTGWFDCRFHSTVLDLTDEPSSKKRVKRRPERVDRVVGHYGLWISYRSARFFADHVPRAYALPHFPPMPSAVTVPGNSNP